MLSNIVGTLHFEDQENPDKEFWACCPRGSAMGFELRIIWDRHCSLPEGEAQIARTAFAHTGFRGLKLAGLVDGGIDPGTGNELVTARIGKRFGLGRGRIMKEWLMVEPAFGASWLPLRREAPEIVSAMR